jgi:hypothetical protein
MRNLIVASAVAAALASGTAMAVTAPTAVDAQAAPIKIFISGSSAAKAAIKASLAGADWCNGNGMTTFASGTPDFNAYSCTAAAGPFNGQSTTIYYRAEGGSVVGVLPVINNVAIKQLDLSAAGGCPQTTTGSVTCVVGGTSAANGSADSWTSGVFTPAVGAQVGISDLEPKVFVGDNFPSNYTFIGAKRTVADLKSATLLPQNIIFQQTFGLIINNTPAGIAGVNNISSQSVRDILTGGFINWTAVPAAPVTTSDGVALVSKVGAGPGVANASTAITLCNREKGSGTRTGTAIYFLGDECTTSASTITDPGPDNFSTGDEITCVSTHPGAIGYVSIDKQAGLPAGVVPLAIDGVLPTNTKAALGQYTWTYEASMQVNPSADANNKSFYNYYFPKLQALATAPQSAQVNVVPNIGTTTGNTPGLPLTSSGIINVSNYTRNGDSCTALSEQY